MTTKIEIREWTKSGEGLTKLEKLQYLSAEAVAWEQYRVFLEEEKQCKN